MAKELTSEAHLIAAMAEHKPVLVRYLDGTIANDAVRINDTYYRKTACRFYLR